VTTSSTRAVGTISWFYLGCRITTWYSAALHLILFLLTRMRYFADGQTVDANPGQERLSHSSGGGLYDRFNFFHSFLSDRRECRTKAASRSPLLRTEIDTPGGLTDGGPGDASTCIPGWLKPLMKLDTPVKKPRSRAHGSSP